MARKMVEASVLECNGYTSAYDYRPGEHPRDKFHMQIACCVKAGWELLGPIQFLKGPIGDVFAIQQIVKYEEIKES